MNTIAILPGGRQICLPPCKKNRGRRNAGNRNEKYIAVQVLNSTNNISAKMTKTSNQFQYPGGKSCSNNPKTKTSYMNKTNIYSSAAITIHLFEDLLDMKRYSGMVNGRLM